MIKIKTFELLNGKEKSFKNIFSLCIGQVYIQSARFADYLGHYDSWYYDVTNGSLKLDNRIFDVEFIGSTSTNDNYWESSEIARIIPDEYVKLMISTRKIMEELELEELTQSKILLTEGITGILLASIYVAFAPLNTVYFCGQNDNVSVYMFVKNLPENIFKRITFSEFYHFISKIIEDFGTNCIDPKLLIESMLIENDIEYKVEKLSDFEYNTLIVAKFDEHNSVKILFGDLDNKVTLIPDCKN
jgi:hypothetical protein